MFSFPVAVQVEAPPGTPIEVVEQELAEKAIKLAAEEGLQPGDITAHALLTNNCAHESMVPEPDDIGKMVKCKLCGRYRMVTDTQQSA